MNNSYTLEEKNNPAFGWLMVIIALFLCLMAIVELQSYRPDFDNIYLMCAFCSVSLVVGIILIVIGVIENKVIESHNKIVELLILNNRTLALTVVDKDNDQHGYRNKKDCSEIRPI